MNRTAQAAYDGQDLSTYLELGAFVQLAAWQFRPLLGAQYTHIMQNSFRESGADSLNLAVAENQTDSMRWSAGVRLFTEFELQTTSNHTAHIDSGGLQFIW